MEHKVSFKKMWKRGSMEMTALKTDGTSDIHWTFRFLSVNGTEENNLTNNNGIPIELYQYAYRLPLY